MESRMGGQDLGVHSSNRAERSGISPSRLSRIETGHRRLSLDQLTAALGKSLDELVESPDDSDVVIRPTVTTAAA